MMDNETKKDIMQGLQLFKEAMLKEYSLNTSPRDIKGENAKDETLPADWGQKLKPLSGGPEGGHEGDSGPEHKNTSTGTQGSDPYIHKMLEEMHTFMKQMADTMAMSHDNEEDVDAGDSGDEMMWDKEDVVEDNEEGGEVAVVDEEEELDKMGNHGMYKDMEGEADDSDTSEIVDALNQIKGILAQADFQKQVQKSIDDRFTALEKQIADNSKNGANQVSDTVKNILKQQGFAPVNNDAPVRTGGEATTVVSKADPVPQHEAKDMSSNVQKSEDAIDFGDDVHEAFVKQVDEIANKTDVEDLRGTFRLLNHSRQQMEGGDLASTLYYYGN